MEVVVARMSRLKRAYLKQRRAGVAEVRLRELNREGHARATSIASDLFQRSAKYLLGCYPAELNTRRRKFLGLEDEDLETPRDVILARLRTIIENAECLASVNGRTIHLIRVEGGYYFLYRESMYSKKSCMYRSRTAAMTAYTNDRIDWLFFQEN